MTDALFWDRIAPKYAAQPIKDTQAYEYTLERTKSYLKKTDRVLELGCGTGSTALRLAPSVAQLTASDLSGGMIEIARTKAEDAGVENVAFHVSDWAFPVEEDQHFDAVLALNLLHLLPDLPAALRHIHALLPRDGLFISKTTVSPDEGASLSYWLIRAVLPVLQFLGKAPFVAFRDAVDLDRMIEEAGFEIIETTNAPARPPNRYIVARKK